MPDIIGQVPSSTGDLPLTKHQQVVSGDDYKAADGRALTWSSSGAWPDLAGASLLMLVGHEQYNLYGNLPLSWKGTVPASPAQPTEISLDVTSLETSNIPQDEYDYQLTATLADGDKVTLAIGKLTVWAAPGTVPLYPPAM
jgi:hypothetical protein